MKESNHTKYNHLPVERVHRGKVFIFSWGTILIAAGFLFFIAHETPLSHPIILALIPAWFLFVMEYSFREIRITPEGLLELSRLTKYQHFVRFEAITRVGVAYSPLLREKYYQIQSRDGEIQLSHYSEWESLLQFIRPRINDFSITNDVRKKID